MARQRQSAAKTTGFSAPCASKDINASQDPIILIPFLTCLYLQRVIRFIVQNIL